MDRFFEGLSRRLEHAWRPGKRPVANRSYRCICGRPVFFRNSECLACHTPLGFAPDRLKLLPLEPGEAENTWQATDMPGTAYRRCDNFDSPAGCNWLVMASDTEPLCVACRLNHTIPDLSQGNNGELWQQVEVAKRRLVSQLLALGLPVKSKESEDPEHGLMFDFLRAPAGAPPVMTGHADGLITLNIEEADDATREQIRHAMHEPYRTLLGHLRHEVGHYYWDRLVRDTGWLEPYRVRFGDEREDYAAALQRHYENGPAPDWPMRCVSAYASTHPWEDWAETWAHYLHMVDTMDTALSFGLDGEDVEIVQEPFGRDALDAPDDPGAARFLEFVNAWVDMTSVLNELSRSMGQHDFYPFVLSKPAVAKLHFVHRVVTSAQLDTLARTAPGTPGTAEAAAIASGEQADQAASHADAARQETAAAPAEVLPPVVVAPTA